MAYPAECVILREPAMKGDAKVVEYLNKALRHELTAVNQYWLHYRLLDNWGYKGTRQDMAQGVTPRVIDARRCRPNQPPSGDIFSVGQRRRKVKAVVFR